MKRIGLPESNGSVVIPVSCWRNSLWVSLLLAEVQTASDQMMLCTDTDRHSVAVFSTMYGMY